MAAAAGSGDAATVPGVVSDTKTSDAKAEVYTLHDRFGTFMDLVQNIDHFRSLGFLPVKRGVNFICLNVDETLSPQDWFRLYYKQFKPIFVQAEHIESDFNWLRKDIRAQLREHVKIYGPNEVAWLVMENKAQTKEERDEYQKLIGELRFVELRFLVTAGKWIMCTTEPTGPKAGPSSGPSSAPLEPAVAAGTSLGADTKPEGMTK